MSSAHMQAITFFEEGEPMIDGEPGDLKFVIRTVPSQRWERRGDDLLINETITLVDALTDRITKPGDYQHYPGQGMPVHNAEPKKGDLWVLYTVAFPTHLSSEQQQQVRDLLGHTHMPIPTTAAA
ncbi:J domain-containing protein [Haematococcus lacustris]|uniref:J domain-containing protein n=1 Tax=Haematococcus lacustris TaxID=44745 RepID=A0A699YSL5_HAELA|nr:J domain-containing protein [Haematococcus lacustris]